MNGKFGKFRGGTAGNELRADGFPGCTVNKPYNVLFIIVNREIDPVAVVFEFNIEYIGFAGFKLKNRPPCRGSCRRCLRSKCGRREWGS